MRAAFGLVALLVGAFIVIYIWSQHTAEVARTQKEIKPQVEQLSGRGADGVPANKSAVLEAAERNGSTKYVEVKSVVPGGALQAYYGLKPGDRIVTIGAIDVSIYDAEMATLQVFDAYQRKHPLKVLREGKEITLP